MCSPRMAFVVVCKVNIVPAVSLAASADRETVGTIKTQGHGLYTGSNVARTDMLRIDTNHTGREICLNFDSVLSQISLECE